MRVSAWECDRGQPDPYYNLSSGAFGCSNNFLAPILYQGPSELDIQKQLTADEEKEQLASAAVESWADSGDDYSETKYLLYGLNLEEHQWVFLDVLVLPKLTWRTRRKLQSAFVSNTSKLLPTSAIELRTSFHRCLIKFRQLQAQYQSEVTILLAQLSTTDTDFDDIQNSPLYLPSSLPPEILTKSSEQLVSMETKLQIGQCCNSLAQICTKLNAKARLLKFKYVNIRHQAPNTHSQNSLNHINTKIGALAVKYHQAFTALKILDPHGTSGWRSDFLELRNQDIRGLSEAELPNAPTQAHAQQLQTRLLLNSGVMPEGNRTVSWIWRGSHIENPGDPDTQNEYGKGCGFHFLCDACLYLESEF